MKIIETIKEKEELFKVIAAAVAFIAAYVTFYFVEANEIVKIAVYLAIYVFIGLDTVVAMVKGFRRSPFNENFLMVVATVGAFVMGEYAEAVAVMLFFSVGELLEDYAREKSENAILSLSEMLPETVTVLKDGKEVSVKVDDVSVGDVLIVKTGDKIACDGVVIDGSASVDNSMITGESLPISALTGVSVMSGGVVASGYLSIEVKATAESSSANKILQLVKEETAKKAEKEKFIRRFAKIYTPSVLIAAVLVAALPPMIGGTYWQGFVDKWFMRALNLLVISCPCALVISVPLAYFTGIGSAFKKGVIVKGGVTLEKAAEIEKVVFDKTGTLTTGNFSVVDTLPKDNEENILRIACSLEKYSNHPVAAAIKSAYRGQTEDLEVEEFAGLGIVGKGQRRYAAGNYKLMKKLGVECLEQNSGGTAVYVAENEKLLGVIVIGDSLKEGAVTTVDSLKKMGLGVAMLTGDNQVAAKAVSVALGNIEYGAGLLPEDKRDRIVAYKKEGKVAFVGDGINDAPALSASDLAVAMGGGTDVAALSSDMIIADNDVKKLPLALKLAKKTSLIVKENIFGSIAVKVAAMVLSVIGIAPMWVAILADVGLMALACLNSMRLMK